MNYWAAVRIAIVGFAGISSALAPSDPTAGATVGWEVVVAGFLFFPAIVCVGLCVLLPFRRAKLKWDSPVWSLNPFDFSQPEQFFHMAGYAMLATGAGLAVANLWGAGGGFAYAFAVAAFGAGILVGLQILEFVAVRQEKSDVERQD